MRPCTDNLILFLISASPYSFESSGLGGGGGSAERIPIGAISLFAAASPRYQVQDVQKNGVFILRILSVFTTSPSLPLAC